MKRIIIKKQYFSVHIATVPLKLIVAMDAII